MSNEPKNGSKKPAAEPDDSPILSVDEQRELFMQFRMQRTRIPKRFADKTLDGFQTKGDLKRKQAKTAAREYLEAFGKVPAGGSPRGLILHGPTGSGKTHILVSILRELAASGHQTLFYNVPNLFKEIRATFDGNEERDEDDLLDDIAKVDVLALDDLGAEKTSDWVLDRLYLIINQRYEACRPTLVTTNHDWPTDLETAVGPRITSRLAEMCKAIGPFPDEDWRMKSAGLERRLN